MQYHNWRTYNGLVIDRTIWNNLPEYLRDPELSIDNYFRRQLKTFLFAQY